MSFILALQASIAYLRQIRGRVCRVGTDDGVMSRMRNYNEETRVFQCLVDYVMECFFNLMTCHGTCKCLPTVKSFEKCRGLHTLQREVQGWKFGRPNGEESMEAVCNTLFQRWDLNRFEIEILIRMIGWLSKPCKLHWDLRVCHVLTKLWIALGTLEICAAASQPRRLPVPVPACGRTNGFPKRAFPCGKQRPGNREHLKTFKSISLKTMYQHQHLPWN